MAGIELNGIEKTYPGGVKAVTELSLSIPQGRFISLLGPSGCGKTTTLRMIAGLETPDRGEIRLGPRVLFSGRTMEAIPTERRGMGLVFQSYALWPHMTVEQNVSFGLEMKHVSRKERRERVQRVCELLRIAGLEKRYPTQLSGGQQQRVALARMLVINPEVLLLDEPLSNLDAKLRLEMRAELKRLHGELNNTIIYVTHDQLEAMTLSTEIAVMSQGRLLQCAPPMEIYRKPASLFVAEFVGNPPINLFRVSDPQCSALCSSLLKRFPAAAASAKTIGVRPEGIAVRRAGAPVPEGWWSHSAMVDTVLPTGSEWIVGLKLDGCPVFALSVEEVDYRPREEVTVGVEMRHFHLFDKEGRRLG